MGWLRTRNRVPGPSAAGKRHTSHREDVPSQAETGSVPRARIQHIVIEHRLTQSDSESAPPPGRRVAAETPGRGGSLRDIELALQLQIESPSPHSSSSCSDPSHCGRVYAIRRLISIALLEM